MHGSGSNGHDYTTARKDRIDLMFSEWRERRLILVFAVEMEGAMVLGGGCY